MSSPRKLTRAVALVGTVLALASPALAEGLGDLRVFSHIGEVFRAEIKVLGMRPSFSTECIVLDPTLNDPESGLPRLRYASIVLDRAGQRLLVTSRDRISEPALHLSLTVTCGTHLTRNYVALLSPPTVEAATLDAAPQATPAPRAAPRPQAAERPPARRSSSAAPRSTGKPSVPKPAVAALPPAEPPAAPPSVPAPLAAPSQPPLGERLELSPPTAELADIEREIAALNAELQRLSAGSGAQSPETQTRILEMETRLVRMELHAARARLQPSGAPAAAPLAAGEASPLPLPTAPAAPETKPADRDARPEAQKTPRRIDSGSSDDGLWYGLGVLVLFGAGLGFYLMRRSSRREEAEVPGEGVFDGGRPASSAAEAKVRVRPATTVAAAAPVAADTLQPEPIPEFARDVAEPDELSPDAEVVKLAEVMSAFGRLDGAIEALRSFIREHPEGALRPRLFLLKLYRDQGNRQAFTELAAKLRSDPRFEAVAWDMPAEELQRLIAAER